MDSKLDMTPRKIIHLDMDAFYASVEQRDHPEWRNRPVIVGGSPKGRGVVCSASYEARKFGVKSAIPCSQAYRLCPQAVFVHPSFEKYKEASQRIHALFHEVTPLVEPLSLDEAYLDVTENSLREPLAGKIAIHLQKRIFEETGLTASAGVAPNKFLAKIASDLRKPRGLVIIPPDRVWEFVDRLPVEKLWGVGPKTASRLHGFGIRTAADIRNYTVQEMEAWVGSFGRFLHELAHGKDDRPVETGWDPKSRGAERTFSRDVLDLAQMHGELEDLAHELARDLKKIDRVGRTLTLKVKYHDFSVVTRSITHAPGLFLADDLLRLALELLQKTDAGAKAVRLLGLSVKGFEVSKPMEGIEKPWEQLEFNLPIW